MTPDLPPPVPIPQVIERLVDCGYPRGAVKIEFDRLLQSEVIYLQGRGVDAPATFGCVRRAANSMYAVDVQFDRQATTDAYREFAYEEGRREDHEQAVAWLRETGRLEALPVFDKSKGFAAHLRALERFCDIPEGLMLKAHGDDFAVYRVDDPLAPPKISNEKFECLMKVLAASNVRAGFLGNAAIKTNEK